MRYWEIIESTSLLELRRNPEQNPKVSTLEALEKYAGRDDVFVSFTSDVGKMSHGNIGKNISGSKLGINPKSKWSTPIGIYTYPVDYVLSKKGNVEFAATEPYLYVVQAIKPLLDFNNYSETDFARDSEKLIDMGFKDTQEDGIEFSKFDIPASWLWNWTREASLKSAKRAVQWSKILRRLGYYGAVDNGLGLIHTNEPIQAVFFSKDAIKVLEVITNKPSDLEKIKTNWSEIHDIIKPSEAVQLAAINQNPYAFSVILGKGIIPSEKVQLAAVQQEGQLIRYILMKGIKPSEQVQLAAVTRSSYALKIIIDSGIIPSEEIQLEAVKKDKWAIKWITEKGIAPSEAVKKAAGNLSEAVKKATGAI